MSNTALMLTVEEKVKARHHTGYLNVAEAQTFALGVPAAVQTQFLIEGAFNRILPEALGWFRTLIDKLDCIEGQMMTDNENLAVTQIASISINKDEHKQLRVEYRYWQGALCNLMGIPPNPFDMRFANQPGINAPVMHGL